MCVIADTFTVTHQFVGTIIAEHKKDICIFIERIILP